MNGKISPQLLVNIALLLAVAVLGANAALTRAQAQEGSLAQQANLGTAFTYQGRLSSDGSPADGSYDLRFLLFGAESGGGQVGGQLLLDDVAVTNGYFTALLDFGDVFHGAERWLEIAVRDGESSGSYTTLSPRQALTAAPYALHARSADNSLGALQCNIDQIARFDGARWICSNSTDAGLQARVAELENDVAALQELLVHLSREGDDLYLTSANLHVVNGTGTTDSKPNSLGNVIIGYNEERTNGTNIRSGSHMLVVGKEHNYTTFGGDNRGTKQRKQRCLRLCQRRGRKHGQRQLRFCQRRGG